MESKSDKKKIKFVIVIMNDYYPTGVCNRCGIYYSISPGLDEHACTLCSGITYRTQLIISLEYILQEYNSLSSITISFINRTISEYKDLNQLDEARIPVQHLYQPFLFEKEKFKLGTQVIIAESEAVLIHTLPGNELFQALSENPIKKDVKNLIFVEQK